MSKVEQAHERLSQEEIRRVKELLWSGGMTQSQVAKVFREEFDKTVHQATVSRIKHGKLGASVPWPDGSRGTEAIPTRAQITWSKESIQYDLWPEFLQLRMLQVVNAERAENKLTEIPPIAPQYDAWITAMADEIPELEVQNAALVAEDSRRSLIMREFRDISSRTQEDLRNLSREVILEDTAEIRVDPPLETGGSPTALRYKKSEWDEVLLRWPKEPIVALARMRQDNLLAEAVRVLCHDFTGVVESDFLRETALRLQLMMSKDESVVARVKADPTFVQKVNDSAKEKK